MPARTPCRTLRPAGAIAIALTLAVLALQGCSQTGDYRRPAANLPEAWQGDRNNTEGAKATAIPWRSFFHDTRLQTLIATALAHNHDLKIALARVAEARAQYSIASADRLPTASLSGNRTKNRIPSAFTGIDRPVTTERDELAITTVSYELDFWGRVAQLSEAAQAGFLASESSSRALRISLIAEVANLYFTVLELDERIAITRASIDSRKRNRDLVKRGQELGAAARSDFLLAEGALHTAQGELANLENQRAAADHALVLLVGKPPGELPPGKPLAEQEVRQDLAPGIPSEVLYARPDVIAAENRLREAHANVAAARAAFLPRILLTAGLGLVSPTLARLFAPGTGNWLYQPSLTMPLFDGGRTSGAADVAEARRNSAVAEYEKTIQQAFREVADLLAARTSLAEQRQAAEAAVDAYRERLIVADARFKSGSISYLEVLDAQKDLFAQQQLAVQVRRAQLSTAAQLYKALGGGDSPDG